MKSAIATQSPTISPEKKVTEKDIDAIKDAKIYLLRQGFRTASTHPIILAALRSLKKDEKLVEAYLNVCEEDGRRKHVVNIGL